MSAQENAAKYILGLDIGANSIGWAMLRAEPDTEGRLDPVAIERTGVRVFEAGVEGSDEEIAKGRDVSRAVDRRTARLARRRLDRLARRLSALHAILRRAGLLPAIDEPPPPPAPPNRKRTARERRERRMAIAQARDKSLAELDKALVKKWQERLKAEGAPLEKVQLVPHVLPYLLRARALDEPLSPHELGRALFHLGQRRGFLSNRKSTPKKDEKPGEVKKGIEELTQRMGAQTLGQYFASLNPHEQPIRCRPIPKQRGVSYEIYTSRQMYKDEFKRICDAQLGHHPDILSDALREQVSRAIFDQRDTKTKEEHIGHCELEPAERRAPWASLDAQRYRMLDQVNRTHVVDPDGFKRPLTDNERSTLIASLEKSKKVEYDAARKKLKIPGHIFNLEASGEKHFVGNRTAAALRRIFRKRWDNSSNAEQNAVLEAFLGMKKDDALREQAKNEWGFDEKSIDGLLDIRLDEGYCRFSQRALFRLLPELEKGITLHTAIKETYGLKGRFALHALLPPVRDVAPDLRNPAVSRALTELRKVVNAIIREYGKPAEIRIELARDMNTREQRKRISAEIEVNRQARQRAKAALKEYFETQYHKESGDEDIKKWLLAEECGWNCPYTGEPMNHASLFGDNPQFQIEHIIPLSRCPGDSFKNLTLCHVRANQWKSGQTPYEAYHGTSDWDTIIQRVKSFREIMISHERKGKPQKLVARQKLWRFQLHGDELTTFLSQFTQSQLNDTRYAAKEAKKYLGLLHGDEAESRVQASNGVLTKMLREKWGLRKSRDDYRHHAVDATVTALVDPQTRQRLRQAAEEEERRGRSRFSNVPPPWETFREDVLRSLETVVASHRVSRKTTGELHKDTFYGPSKETDERGQIVFRLRRALTDLSKKDIENPDVIVDRVVGDAVRAKFQELGQGEPKDLFKDERNLPFLVCKKKGKEGQHVIIRKVRVRENVPAKPIGEGPRLRYVQMKEIHHLEVFEKQGADGQPLWDGEIVTLFEVARRIKEKDPNDKTDPVYRRYAGGSRPPFYSLAKGEIIQLGESSRIPGLYRVRTVFRDNTSGKIMVDYVGINDAREKKAIQEKHDWNRTVLDTLIREYDCRKVIVTPLAEVRWAND